MVDLLVGPGLVRVAWCYRAQGIGLGSPYGVPPVCSAQATDKTTWKSASEQPGEEVDPE